MYSDLWHDVRADPRLGRGRVAGRLVARALALVRARVLAKVVFAVETWTTINYLLCTVGHTIIYVP